MARPRSSSVTYDAVAKRFEDGLDAWEHTRSPVEQGPPRGHERKRTRGAVRTRGAARPRPSVHGPAGEGKAADHARAAADFEDGLERWERGG